MSRRKKSLQERQQEMRQRNGAVEQHEILEIPLIEELQEQPVNEKNYTLAEAKEEIKVGSYSTARRLFQAAGCGRYSCGGESVVFGSNKQKHERRRRMSYVITQSDVDRVKKLMRGEQAG